MKRKNQKLSVKTRKDINELIGILVPTYVRAAIENKTSLPDGKKHATVTIINSLWGGGSCRSVHIKKLCLTLIRAGNWEEEAIKNHEWPMYRRRLQKSIERINKRLISPEFIYKAFIAYDKKQQTYKLLLADSDIDKVVGQVSESNKHATFKTIDIQLTSKSFKRGKPIMCLGSVIQFRMKSPISGYLHVFHRDGNGLIDKLFPVEAARIKIKSVRHARTKEYCFPHDFLKEGYFWTVGNTQGKDSAKQTIIVVVTRQDLSVSVGDLEYLGVEAPTRGVSLAVPKLKDLAKSSIGLGTADYVWQNRQKE